MWLGLGKPEAFGLVGSMWCEFVWRGGGVGVPEWTWEPGSAFALAVGFGVHRVSGVMPGSRSSHWVAIEIFWVVLGRAAWAKLVLRLKPGVVLTLFRASGIEMFRLVFIRRTSFSLM